ncbi:arylamine N-acetyltransferase [candidate division CSSED10-310 bacterium]|uniref:Arylamine N-acetyltransferase n=1 Tax=candidate division CSSED10-310 bacterium TaxID=2855610 RepID=A0ABV6Z221_UNCC1
MSTERQGIGRFLDQAGISADHSSIERLARAVKTFAVLPYENITKIIRLATSSGLARARRMPDEVLRDHFRWYTGGTCFSLVNTLKDIVCELDFEPQILMADMRVGENVHCALKVKISGTEFLLDPGYLLDEPIPLNYEQATYQHNPMNVITLEPEETAAAFNISVIRRGEKKWRYRLKMAPVSESEFLQHWDRSFSMNMMNSLTLSRVSPSGQLYFSRSRMHIVKPEKRKTDKVRGLEAACIKQHFQIDPDLVRKALLILEHQRNSSQDKP